MVNDEIIIKEFLTKDGKINPNKTKIPYLDKHVELKEYLENRFQDGFISHKEVIGRIVNKIEKRPTCKVCGKELKYKGLKHPYGTWCSCQCQLTDKDFIEWRNKNIDFSKSQEKMRQTCLEKYGDANWKNTDKRDETMLERYGVTCWFSGKTREEMEAKNLALYGKRIITNPKKGQDTKLKKYGDPFYTNREKAKQTMISRYGVPYTLLSPELREKCEETKEKLYGDKHYFNHVKAEETNLKRYGVKNVYQAKFVRDKIDYNKALETKKIRHTFNSSKQEDRLYGILCQLYGKDNIIREYKDERYKNPDNGLFYCCDFYVQSLDLFIELQGHYTHGTHPFNENNAQDVEMVKVLKESSKPTAQKTIDVWCNADVKKRKVALNNNLKYLEIFGVKFNGDSVKEDVDAILHT